MNYFLVVSDEGEPMPKKSSPVPSHSIQDKEETKWEWRLYIIASIIRLVLILYGEIQDSLMLVKYTDVDYWVFSDAARYVYNGESAYNRATYRYTPLLAYLLLPNTFLHKSFGKFIFAFSDIVVGVLITKILLLSGMCKTKKEALWYTATWLFNPIVVNVSTRGNSEALISVLVLLSFYFIVKGNLSLGSIIYGLAVHFKIYPILYSFALLFFINRMYIKNGQAKTNLFNKQCIQFVVLSASTFLLITLLMYYIEGWKFLDETYLYHVTRKDNRHNFSVLFYSIYLSSASPSAAAGIAGVVALIPPLLLVLCFTHKYYSDITFCMFLQTFTFVAFNKVCTVQYFVWYFALLPLVLPNLRINLFWKGAALIAFWFGSQSLWLYFAYNLEFLGKNTFLQIWMAGILFLCSNLCILTTFINNYSPFTWNLSKQRKD